jgi:glycosidase
MFQWDWDSIASECTNFIGPAGYGYVQVSPPQEHITGDQWWTDYQPVSYTMVSKRGNRDQFSNMITTCHAAGVKVITDTIFNHMTAGAGIGIAGSPYTHHVYPGLYDAHNFHYCGLEPNDIIVNYKNRAEVQTCELLGLADLATDTDEYVKSRLAEFGNDLLSLGVDGMRIDAAKHMATEDIANIISRFNSTPYITQEVIWGKGEPIQPSEYLGNGDVQEFRYTGALMNAFLGGDISSLKNLDNRGWIPSGKANVFVTNHDTERAGHSLNNNSPSNTYVTAMIFSLAHPYGTPTILSSYDGFTTFDAGAPNGRVGTCAGNRGENGWICQHRWTAISGMTGFRNTVGAEPMNSWVSPRSSRIAFGRGSAGFVAINNDDSPWSTTFTTLLADGTYCDVISGASASGSCTGASFAVSGGSLSATVPARNAIAVHTESMCIGNGTSSSPLTFSDIAFTTYGRLHKM